MTEYYSNTLTYTRDDVQGYLIKRIDNRKIYHTSNFHKRYFILDFDRGQIDVKKSNKES